MTLSIWRYSHYLLAVITGVFIFIASVTGIILSFEPISEKYSGQKFSVSDEVLLVKTISQLQKTHQEVYSISVDENDFVLANLITKEGKSGDFYINPLSGEILGQPEPKSEIFEFATNLHRSLFLKSTGRLIIGVVSFLLLLIALSGFVLVAKRQGGIKKWFSKVVYEKASTYYHVTLSRWTIVPIIIITISGVFLSLDRFSILPQDELKHEISHSQIDAKEISIENFEIFNQYSIYDISSLEFPFSPFEEDHFILKTPQEELYVNQFTGEIISEAKVSAISQIVDWSLFLHTGQGSILWSAVLGLSSIVLIILMISGYVIAYNRISNSSTFKNKFSADEAECIILVGSETGSTFKFAHRFADALLKAKKTVFVDALNNFSNYKKAKHLLVFTATYGEGEAPANASGFKDKLQDFQSDKSLKYSVVGFGSLAYPDFCQFAIEVDQLFNKQDLFHQNLPLFKINKQSEKEFAQWTKQWNASQHLNLKFDTKAKKIIGLHDFEVTEISGLNNDDTYIIKLKPKRNLQYQSGDLLIFYPTEDFVERQYSIARINDKILLSIKRHEFGICSNFLFNQQVGKVLKAKLKANPKFHLPKTAKNVIMISNGTGIAPFLGMLSAHPQIKKHLLWGGRDKNSIALYRHCIDSALKSKSLDAFEMALSRGEDSKYVQDLISVHINMFTNAINNKGVIMICGSIAMQNQVLRTIEDLIIPRLGKTLLELKNSQQLKMDCY